MLLSGSKLGDRLGDGLNINVCDLDSLVVVDFEGFVDDSRWAFDGNTLVRALALL
jgi:hypothetical protein